MNTIRSYFPPIHTARPARRSSPRRYSPGAAVRSGYRGQERKTFFWVLLLAAGGLAALAILIFAAWAGVYAFALATGEILPGVRAGVIPAGSMTQNELAQKLDQQWNHQNTLVLTDGAHSWTAAPLALGLYVDPQATASRAYQVGRGPQALQEWIWLARFGNVEVEPVVIFSPQAAQAGLERLAGQINQPARNASLQIQNGQWTSIPGQNGSNLDIERTMAGLAAQQPEKVLASGSLQVVTQPVAPRVNDLTPVLSRLRSMLDRPLTLQAYDPITDERLEWSVPREELSGWVLVEPVGDDFTLRLDEQRLNAYLEEWKLTLGAEKTLEPFSPPGDLAGRWQNGQPITVMVRHNPTTYTVQPGDTLSRIAYQSGMPYWKIQQANPAIDANHLSAGQVLTIPSKNDMLTLPVVTGKRIVVSIRQQRMWTYQDGAVHREYVVSTGIDRSPTNPGIYQIRTHELNAYASAWDLYMPHFMGIYEGWPGFMNGIHGLPTLSSGQRLWAGYLGKPISYGCIVLGLQDAEELYQWAEEGVIVEIQP